MIYPLIVTISAAYNRFIGEFNSALEELETVIRMTDDIYFRLSIQIQIGTILYCKHDLNVLYKLVVKLKREIENLPESDENVAEIYNLHGLYFIQKGRYKEAQAENEKAIKISEGRVGKEYDISFKFKSNLLEVKRRMGESIEDELQKIFKIILQDSSAYPESLPSLLNHLYYLENINIVMGGKRYKEAKRILEIKFNSYDIASYVIYKCNMYRILMENNNDMEAAEKLRSELKTFFRRECRWLSSIFTGRIFILFT